jgi:hypothetical protein
LPSSDRGSIEDGGSTVLYHNRPDGIERYETKAHHSYIISNSLSSIELRRLTHIVVQQRRDARCKPHQRPLTPLLVAAALELTAVRHLKLPRFHRWLSTLVDRSLLS